MIEEAKSFNQPTYNQDGSMDWEFFLNCSKLIYKYHLTSIKERVKVSQNMRRAVLKRNQEKEKMVYG